MCVQIRGKQGSEGGHHAGHNVAADQRAERGEHQDLPPPPEKPAQPSLPASTPGSPASTFSAARSSCATMPAKLVPSRPAALATVSSWAAAAASYSSAVDGSTPASRHSAFRPSTAAPFDREACRGRSPDCPTRTCHGRARRNPATPARWRRAGPHTAGSGAGPAASRRRAVHQPRGTGRLDAGMAVQRQDARQGAGGVRRADEPGSGARTKAQLPAQAGGGHAVAVSSRSTRTAGRAGTQEHQARPPAPGSGCLPGGSAGRQPRSRASPRSRQWRWLKSWPRCPGVTRCPAFRSSRAAELLAPSRKTLSQKLAKGCTPVKKPFTLVRSRCCPDTSRPGRGMAAPAPASTEGKNQSVEGHDDQRRPHGR